MPLDRTRPSTIFLDLDGVLADFVGGICLAHSRPNPFLDPANAGRYQVDEIWGMAPAEFWKPCDESFWAFLEPTPEAEMIVELADRLVGEENVCVLTAPSENPGCVPGKLRWLDRHFGIGRDRVLFGSCKHFCAAPHAVLVDDHLGNAERFWMFGGHAVLYPRPWNPHGAEGKTAAWFVEELTRIVRG